MMWWWPVVDEPVTGWRKHVLLVGTLSAIVGWTILAVVAVVVLGGIIVAAAN